jgi:lysocardiolipin and lysophospholipid acyltransferase
MGIIKLKRGSGPLAIFWYFMWTPFITVYAVVPLIVLNIIQFPSLVLLPFSVKLFRKYQRLVTYIVWGWWVFGVQKISGVKLIVSGDEVPKKENAIVITNHQSMCDILFLLCFAFNRGAISYTKWMAKDIIKWIPGIGWGLLFLENIFLKRNWADDSKTIESTFSHITKGNIPIWMCFFPEGTRWTQQKHIENTEFGTKNNLRPVQHVLYPRPKGFLATIEGLADHTKAIYSITIGYPEGAPSLIRAIRGEAPVVHMNICRTLVTELPNNEEGLKKWLLEDIYRKDELLKGFSLNSKF